MKLTRLFFIAGGNLLVGPGAMGHGAFEESAIAKIVGERSFERIVVLRIVREAFQGGLDSSKTPEAESILRQSFRR